MVVGRDQLLEQLHQCQVACAAIALQQAQQGFQSRDDLLHAHQQLRHADADAGLRRIAAHFQQDVPALCEQHQCLLLVAVARAQDRRWHLDGLPYCVTNRGFAPYF